VIFGAAGDLTKRKLVPALYNLKAAGLLPREFATTQVVDALWAELRGATYFQAGELSDPAVYAQLANLLAEIAKRHGTGGNVLFYLATPPSLFGEVVRQLGSAGLVQADGDSWRRVIVEKPSGTISSPPARSAPSWPGSSARTRSTGSITISARRPSRTS
jgi:glucose-6-phosphate 1-dehydrogenase